MAPLLGTSTQTRSTTSSKFIVALALVAGAAAMALMTIPSQTVRIQGFTGTPPVVDPLIITTIDLTRVQDPIFKQVSVGSAAVCALKVDGTVWCWGDNRWGELGVPPTLTMMSKDPVQVKNADGTPFTGVKQISIGKWPLIGSACALKNDNTMWCWGVRSDQTKTNDFDSGLRPIGYSSFPIQQKMNANGTPIQNVTKIDISRNFCFIRADKTAWCWGVNRLGDVSYVADHGSAYPVQIRDVNGVALNNAMDIQAGYSTTCIITSNNNNAILCFGDGAQAQLGDNTFTPHRYTPDYVWDNAQLQPAAPFLGAAKLAIGDYHGCVLDKFGSVACWGQCNLDKINLMNLVLKPGEGNCSTDAKYFPDGNGKLFTNVYDLGSGNVFSCALKDAGSIWCWGANEFQQLGNGQKINSWKTAVQANVQGQSLKGFTQLSVGETTVCGIWEGNIVACWGLNAWSQVGNNCNNNDCPPSIVSFK